MNNKTATLLLCFTMIIATVGLVLGARMYHQERLREQQRTKLLLDMKHLKSFDMDAEKKLNELEAEVKHLRALMEVREVRDSTLGRLLADREHETEQFRRSVENDRDRLAKVLADLGE